KLFVERRLRTARLVSGSGPEARRVRRKSFVDPDELILDLAKLEFAVGNEDAAGGGMASGAMVDFQTDRTHLFGQRAADQIGGVIKRDIFVVARGSLGGGRENRFRKLVGLAQARLQSDAADFSGCGVFLPAGTAEITAYHAFDGKRIGLADEHGAAGKLLAIGVKRSGKAVRPYHVVRNDILQQIKPEQRKLRENSALVGDGRRHDHVECGKAVGRDDQQLL